MGYIILIYDIPDDRIRHKVSERCKDYGLDRIQYGKKQGNIRLQPVCTRDLALTKEILVEPAS